MHSACLSCPVSKELVWEVSVFLPVHAQVKEGECEGLKQKLEVLEVRYAALEYQLQADKEEHTTRYVRTYVLYVQ